MKYKMMLFILLSMSIPVIGMGKDSNANACMIYSNLTTTVPNMYCTLMQAGVAAAHFAMNHPKISPIIDKATAKAREGAFIMPALIAYNSEAIKNGIMGQLPQLREPFNTCLDTTIKKTLVYGGIALTGYLFYTQTWGCLTKGNLAKIFAPLMSKAEINKELAHHQYMQAIQSTKMVEKMQKQANTIRQNFETAQIASEIRNLQINTKTIKLTRINEQNEQASEQLQRVLDEVNIPALTSTINTIENKYNENIKEKAASIQETQESIEKNTKKFVIELKQAMQVHLNRSHVNQIMTKELESDVDNFFEKVITLANSIFATRCQLQYALCLTEKIEQQAEKLQQMSDSESEYATSDDESESGILLPRGMGSSKKR